ncbi:MAG: glycosyltransferase family 2 protein [Candidatus Eremiobacteraeota bacterium]|nr:glycosyltransferase family 2 protein [Candidatus Eremiobacteraeota bacterium]
MISVAMITMNEEDAIAKVVEDIRKHAPGAEILIVDSSKDRTAEIAESLGVKVIKQFPPRGYGPAMDCALRSASGDVVVTLDCDNTYPASMIPELAKLVTEEGYDLVDGSRLKKKPEAMPLINYLANAGFALLASMLFLRHLTDLHSGMRAYRKTLIDELRYDPKGAALPVELLLRPLRMGRRVKVVFIDYFERVGKSTMRPLESAWWTLVRIGRSRFR